MILKKENMLTLLVLALILISGILVYIFYPGSVTPTEETVSNGTAQQNTPVAASESLKKQSSTYLARDGVYVVQYTESGFVPKSLQIPRGKSIRFINMSNKGMRVFTDDASNPVFTELNQAKTVGKGGTYTFSFTKAGLWAYHNEVNTTDKASILVY